MFPDLFKFKRATTSGFSEYTWERATLGVHHPEIEDFVSSQDSLLDEFIPPDVILDTEGAASLNSADSQGCKGCGSEFKAKGAKLLDQSGEFANYPEPEGLN